MPGKRAITIGECIWQFFVAIGGKFDAIILIQ